LAVAVALVMSGCVSAPTKAAGPRLVVPDCATSRQVDDLPVFALAVSAQGRVCWEAPLGVPVEDGHSFSTPLLSEGTAFLDADSDVYAIDIASGRRLWRWESGDPARVGGAPGGTGTVAAVDGVVTATQGVVPARPAVVALDQRTGAVRWRRAEPADNFSGPLDSGDGGTVFMAYDGRVVEVLNDTDGAVRWTRPGPPVPTGNGPVEVTSLFASTAGDLIFAAPQGGIDGVNTANGSLRWHYAGSVNDLVAEDGVLLATPPPSAPPAFDVPTTALDPVTGQRLWTYGPLDPGGSVWSTVGGMLMHVEYGPASGQLTRVDPQTGRVVWHVATEAYATADGGNVIADTESTGYQSGAASIVGRDPGSGAALWRTPVPVSNLIDDDLLALDGPTGRVLVVEAGQQLFAYDATTGAAEWQLQLPADASIDGVASAYGGLVMQVSQTTYAIEGH